MPTLSPTSWVVDLISRDNTSQSSSVADPGNNTSNAPQVICAWPVSSQYGPGLRFMYYFLVGACVLAHRSEWLRNACLAAALLFPAVAAIHGIVLASLRIQGAVDMDVYGAFQLCSIGILAAPATVRLSNTYWNDPGRNIIFLWTSLILAGLLSLTVEFYRFEPSTCDSSAPGGPVPSDPKQFPYDQNPTCGITCSVTDGPFSPMRGGSANNIYVIPAPQKLPFGTATALSAACCILAMLLLLSMAFKLLGSHWRRGGRAMFEEERINEPIEGTNGATIREMRGIDSKIRYFLSVVEAPVFGGLVLAIVVIGELNFFSTQVNYQIEPIGSVGQWAPIAGTIIAALGSLYVLLAADMVAVEKGVGSSGAVYQDYGNPEARERRSTYGSQRVPDTSPGLQEDIASSGQMQEIQRELSGRSQRSTGSHSPRNAESSSSDGLDRADTQGPEPSEQPSRVPDAGARRRVAQTLITAGKYFGSRANNLFDEYEFKNSRATDFPEIPGEEHRNPDLNEIRRQYNQPRASDGYLTPALNEQRSRGNSFIINDNSSGLLTPNTRQSTFPSLPQPAHSRPP